MTDAERKPGLLSGEGWQKTAVSAAPERKRPARGNSVHLENQTAGVDSAAVINTEAADTKDESETAEQLSSVALMLLGIFGGLYLLYTAGWFMVARLYSQLHILSAQGGGTIWLGLEVVFFWSAVFAPAAWFFTAYALGKRNLLRLLILLVLGALALIPLPLFITAAV